MLLEHVLGYTGAWSNPNTVQISISGPPSVQGNHWRCRTEAGVSVVVCTSVSGQVTSVHTSPATGRPA